MPRLVALLRGINVGGHKRVPMADLRDLLSDLGHTEVEKILQSGNAVFRPHESSADPDSLAPGIEAAISSRLGFDVSVLIRTAGELTALIAANPLREAEGEPSKLHVAFLSADPTPSRLESLDAAHDAPDVVRVGARALYVWYRDGAGRSKLTNDRIERRLGVVATSRNWNTVTKLADLARR